VKPRFVGADGQPIKALPAASDPEVAASLAELKKQAASLLREIAGRVETRLSTGERMTPDHFTEVYVLHGLARPLAASLVWGIYSHDGALLEAFAIDAPPRSLRDDVQVGLVHPTELRADDLARWKTRFPQQPITQLTRHCSSFADAAAFERALTAFVNRTVATGALMGLERRQWERGEQVGGGRYLTLLRSARGVSVELEFEPGIVLGDPGASADQRLTAVTVSFEAQARTQWQTLRVVLSEIEGELRSAGGDA
jgi:Domain of unknown function (DUF4132)